MKWLSVLILLIVIAGNSPAHSMSINADPRSIISAMDKSLPPELDILRVTTSISQDNHLAFQVKIRGDIASGDSDHYLLLQILHEKNYILLIPINKDKEDKILIYEDSLQSGVLKWSEMPREFSEHPAAMGFNAKHIFRGAEFTIPLDWINYSANFGFDAYTVQANIQGGTLQISKVYDHARKGRNEEKQISAITLLNKICNPKK